MLLYGTDYADTDQHIDEDGAVHGAPSGPSETYWRSVMDDDPTRNTEDPLTEAMPLPAPEPLDPPVVPPAFPVDALPGYVAGYVLGLAHQFQTPVDMPAVAALGALSACAGGRVEVEARPGWREPANVYLMCFSDPASRKTGIVRGPVEPIRKAERRLQAIMEPQHVEARTRWSIADKAAEKAVQSASAASDAQERAALEEKAVEERRRANEIVVPPLPRLLAEDATPEALLGLMADNNGRSAIIAAETDALDTLVGRYSKAANLTVILKGHSGESHHTDRKGRAAEHIEHMNLTLMLMGQPSVLQKMVENTEFAGRGVLARLLVAVPNDTVGYRTPGTEPVHPDVARHYAEEVEALALRLAGVREDPFGDVVVDDDQEQLPVLCFSRPADARLLEIEQEIEPQLREDGALGDLTGWGGKLAGATVRLAGLLHLAEHAVTELIEVETVERAWEIARYFTEHARIAFRKVGLIGDTNAHRVLQYLQEHQPKEFSVRDLHNALKGSRRFAQAVFVSNALEVLEEKGWVFRKPLPPREPGKRGRPPSPTFEPHPILLQPPTV